MTGFGSQRSVAVTVGMDGIALQFTDTFEGTPVITGAFMSTTWIVCVFVKVLLHASVSNQVLFIVYFPAQVPGVFVSVKLKVTLEQLSVNVGVAATGIL